MNTHMIYSRSLWNGWQGNACVENKDYITAVKYYNNAIELYPLEYRYFVNRSYCFDKMRQYESALEDSLTAIILNPDWGKCHFRKGRALKGLKKLEESKHCFLKVLQLEGNDCQEAKRELLSIRKLAIISLGGDSKTTFDVANKANNINEAIETIKQMDHFVEEDKSTDKRKLKLKRNQNSAKSKNMSYLRQQNFARNDSNTRNDKMRLEKASVSSQSDSKSYHSDRVESNNGKHVLKKLSAFLLNTNNHIIEDNLNNNHNNNGYENVENARIESSTKPEEKAEPKCSKDDNKSIKSLSSEKNHSNESKSRFNVNKNNRNGQKSNNMDQIVEIWEDSSTRNMRSLTVRSHNSYNSDNPNRHLEPTNPWRLKGLWVSNIIPTDQSKKMLREILSKFGKITFFGIIPESETAIINFDNPESPRLAMSKLQGAHIANICVNNERLNIKFRPLNDDQNYSLISSATERELNNECYFWRTTGCNYFRYCPLKHIPANKGVDLQPWMQNRRHKKQHRQRGNTLQHNFNFESNT